LEELGIDGRVILKWIINRMGWCDWTYVVQEMDNLMLGNRPSSFVKYGEFSDYLRYCQLL
jgi:hypothetical protein